MLLQEKVRAAAAKVAEVEAARQTDKNSAASTQASLEAQLAAARKGEASITPTLRSCAVPVHV